MTQLTEFLNESISKNFKDSFEYKWIVTIRPSLDKKYYNDSVIINVLNDLFYRVFPIQTKKEFINLHKFHNRNNNLHEPFENYFAVISKYLLMPFLEYNIEHINDALNTLNEIEVTRGEKKLCIGFMKFVGEYIEKCIEKTKLAFDFDEEDLNNDAQSVNEHDEILNAFYKFKKEWINGPFEELNNFVKYTQNNPKQDKFINILRSCNKTLVSFWNKQLPDYYKIVFPDIYDKYKDKFNKVTF